MSMSSVEALVVWLNTFSNTTVKCSSLADLADGIQLYEIVAEIVPHRLDLGQCKREKGNWVLAMQNVKNVVSTLQRFFVEEHQMDLRLEERLEPKAIAQNGDEAQLRILVEAVLGAAVECEEKALYIGRIMELPPDCQKQMMLVIEGVMELQSQSSIATIADSTLDVSHAEDAAYLRMQLEETQGELERVRDERDEAVKVHERVSQQLFDAEALAVRLKEEKESYASAVRDLEQQMIGMQQQQQETAAAAAAASTEGESRIIGLTSTIEDKSRELAAQALQEEVAEKTATIQQLRKRLTDAEKGAAEARELRDELDVAKEQLAGREQDKERMQRMRQRLEEEKDLKSLLADTEAQRDRLKGENEEQQREINKLLGAAKAMEALKGRAAEIHAENSKHAEEKEKLSLQLSRATQANAELEAKISFLTQQNVDLEAVVVNLQDDLDAKRADVTEDSMGSISFSEGLNEEMKERLLKIEIENERLSKLMAEENAEHDTEVAEMQQAEAELQGTVAHLKETIATLEANAKASEEAAGASASELTSSIAQLQEELKAKEAALGEATASLAAAQEEISALLTSVEQSKTEAETFKNEAEAAKAELQQVQEQSDASASAAEESAKQSASALAELEQKLQEKTSAEAALQEQIQSVTAALEEEKQRFITAEETAVAQKKELETQLEKLRVESESVAEGLKESAAAGEAREQELSRQLAEGMARLQETEASLALARQQMEEAAAQAKAADNDMEGSLAKQQETIRELQEQLQQQRQAGEESARRAAQAVAEAEELREKSAASEAALSEELQAMKSARETAEQQLQKALEQQSSDEEETHARLEEGERKLRDSEAELAQAQQRLQEMTAAAEAAANDRSGAVKSMAENVSVLEAALEQEKKETETLKELLASLEETKDEVEERNRDLAQQLAASKAQLEQSLSQAVPPEQLQALQAENANLSQLVTQQAQKVADMQKLASDSVAQRDQIRQQLLELSSAAKSSEREDAERSVASGQAGVLQAQLQEKEAAVAQLEMELRMVSSSLHALGLKMQKEYSGGQALKAASFEPMSFLGQRRAAAGM